jgi:hypothetical protein
MRSRFQTRPREVRIWSAIALLCVVAAGVTAIASPRPTASQVTPMHLVRVGDMKVDRAANQATLLHSGLVLITGGCAGQGCEQILASAEVYDPATRSFRLVAPMGTPRASHAAVALPDGRVLVSGGWTGRRATTGAEVYDPDANRWTAVGDMTEERASLIATLLRDGRVLVIGGGEGGLGNLATAEVFDPATSTFSAVGSMRSNHYLATALADGRVLVTGGLDADGKIAGSAEIFDPSTNEFRAAGSMSVRRVKHGAALLSDGTVLIVGGSDERGYRGRYSSTEIYDPATGEFSLGPSMQWGRHKLRDAVVLLPSGSVLVAGGAVHPEVFDPARKTFVPVAGELGGPQMFATATLLPDGDILVLGGYDDRTQSSSAAWLIRPTN